MSTERYKQMLGEAMRKVKRAEALIAKASTAESHAFHKKLSKRNVNANLLYNKSLRVSEKAKNLLNNAYESLSEVKQEIRESMKRSSMKKGGKHHTRRKRTHCKRTHRKRKQYTHRH
jgi:hypothetical protein